MTKKELIEMVGNDDTDLALEILLLSVKKPFLEMTIRAMLKDDNPGLEKKRVEALMEKLTGASAR